MKERDRDGGEKKKGRCVPERFPCTRELRRTLFAGQKPCADGNEKQNRKETYPDDSQIHPEVRRGKYHAEVINRHRDPEFVTIAQGRTEGGGVIGEIGRGGRDHRSKQQG
jgi:hypothetical protein